MNLYSQKDKIFRYIHENTSEDEFIQLLLKIREKKNSYNKLREKYFSMVVRYDYMFDEELKKFQQIEFNTIASSMGIHSFNLTKLLH